MDAIAMSGFVTWRRSRSRLTVKRTAKSEEDMSDDGKGERKSEASSPSAVSAPTAPKCLDDGILHRMNWGREKSRLEQGCGRWSLLSGGT